MWADIVISDEIKYNWANLSVINVRVSIVELIDNYWIRVDADEQPIIDSLEGLFIQVKL